MTALRSHRLPRYYSLGAPSDFHNVCSECSCLSQQIAKVNLSWLFCICIFSQFKVFKRHQGNFDSYLIKLKFLSTTGVPWDPGCLWLYKSVVYTSVALIRVSLPAVSPGHALGCEA